MSPDLLRPMGVLLSPCVYDFLQIFINRDFSKSFNIFNSHMGLVAGEAVLDIGCGTGLISKRYTEKNINYVGIDSDFRRISRAKQLNPDAKFFCGDLRENEILEEVVFKNVILHGVLHHLSDFEVEALYLFLKEKCFLLFQ
jgi:trans-aconitate methyltransferase